MHKRFLSLSRIVGVVVVGAACSESPSTPNPLGPGTPAFERQGQPGHGLFGIEQEFAEVSDTVPEFAGAYYDQTGALIIQLVNPSPAGVQKVVRQLERRGRRVERPTARAALHGFTELVQWRQQIRSVLPAGVYSLDVDEVSNKLQLGVFDMSIGASVRAAAVRVGIPAAAIEVVKSPRPGLRQTLRDEVDPLRGGAQITWDQTGAFCTLFISGLSPGGTAGFFTASHCSDVYAGPDGDTKFFQPVYGLWKWAGTELDDPIAFSGGTCAAGRVCRNADILFARISLRSTGANTIFKPTGAPAAGADGSITIAGTFTVIAGPPAVVGDSLQKVGRTSGWTKGAISATCVDKFTGVLKAGQEVWILCNDVSSVWSKGGDSGSPMFRPSGQNVQLLGILWGGPPGNFNETWHSPCANIAQDLPFYQAYCS